MAYLFLSKKEAQKLGIIPTRRVLTWAEIRKIKFRLIESAVLAAVSAGAWAIWSLWATWTKGQ